MHFGNCTEQSPLDCETVRPEPVLAFCWHASLPACLLHPSCTCVATVLVSIELSFAVLFCSFLMRCTALKLHCLMLSANPTKHVFSCSFLLLLLLCCCFRVCLLTCWPQIWQSTWCARGCLSGEKHLFFFVKHTP